VVIPVVRYLQLCSAVSVQHHGAFIVCIGLLQGKKTRGCKWVGGNKVYKMNPNLAEEAQQPPLTLPQDPVRPRGGPALLTCVVIIGERVVLIGRGEFNVTLLETLKIVAVDRLLIAHKSQDPTKRSYHQS